MSLSFAVTNSAEFYKKLKEEYNNFMADTLSSSKAINLAMTAYHMTEWVYGEYEASKGISLNNFRASLHLLCPQLDIMKDITNGSKHFGITKYAPKTKSATEQKGDFSSDFSFDFNVSCLAIEMNDGTKHYYEVVVTDVMIFWDVYLLQHYQIPTLRNT